RRARYSIARGALLAPFYAIILTILAIAGSGSVAGQSFDLIGSASVSISPSAFHAFLYGLLWGAVFGPFRGGLPYSGGAWLSVAQSTLQSVRNGRLAGALAGAVTAYICGMVLVFGTGLAYFAYNFTQSAATTLITQADLSRTQTDNGLLLLVFALT